MRKYVARTFLTIIVLGLLSPFLLVGYYYFQDNYDIDSLIDYKPTMTSVIYAKNGERIANVFYKKDRFYAPFDEIPPRVIEALLAIEDTTFFEHYGVNPDAIFRAIIKDIKAGKMVEGASTITQQLAKNKLLTREKKLSRKIKELIYSLKIERYLTKEQILERYLNEIYFGHSYYGVKTAADGYFHKKLSDLTLKEMAILVGLPKAPSTYAPTRNYELSMGRANRVISRMHTLGWVDDATYTKSLAENPVVYDDTLTKNKAPFIVDEVAREFAEMGINNFRTGGYEVHTTIDLRLQDVAKESLKYAYDLSLERVKEAQEKYNAEDHSQDTEDDYNVSAIDLSKLNGALVSLDSHSGDVLALVGSVDYKESSFNRATQGRRQPGSAFKPFIYQVAINMGYSGATELVDIAKTFEYEKNGEDKKWQPKNYEKNYEGLITLRKALVHSRNLATINLVNDIGLAHLIKELEKFNIEDIPHDLSIALGTMSISPLKLAEYYTLFANGGVQVVPHLIDRIEQNSKIIYEHNTTQIQLVEPTQSFIMATILRDVVEHGTGRRARAKGIELAGKTGTTNNNIDGWFAGFSPTMETIVWFGNDDNTPMYKRETGGRIAGPAFSKYYENVLKLYPQIKRKFDVPEGITEVRMKNGDKEYFSDISKPPHQESAPDAEAELLF